ncbi:amidase [Xylophilus sp. GOD-11R]|uniref:amidase n=1 Tax=Xylophilus sp. GOD-11R TaxID=3089814 RepID=UPI00298D32D9|nr:amidase [Xylophilus sp. GOD-11R]WPB55577.1 amidase [Xylophilus sp. GOD-11R]
MTAALPASLPAAADESLCLPDAHALLQGFGKGAFTPSQVTDAYLARIARLDGRLHAYVLVLVEQARAQAAESDARWRAGTPRALEGLPVAIKDLIELEGHDTTAGSATRRGRPSTITATLARRLREAGAVILGKVHTAEFAFGSWGDNEHLGAPLNPWRLDEPHTPGGSSSGSGVAVAGRLAVAAIGTDTGGSVRIPAAFNGVVGLKTSFGRISGHGVVPLSPSLDTPGVLARSVPDAALVYQVLQGHDALDPRTWARPPALPVSGPLDDLSDLRLAALCDTDRQGIAPSMLAAYDDCLDRLRALGATVEPVVLEQPVHRFGDPTPMAAEAFALHGAVALDPASLMDRTVRQRVLGGDMPAADYLRHRETVAAQSVDYHRRMVGFDAFVLPTTQVPAVPLASIGRRTNASVLTRFANLFGLCGVALPSGYDESGLPLSLQICCAGYQEHVALRLAESLERATADARHYPEI